MTALLFASALASAATVTGYISDSMCGASNGNGSAEARTCTKDCLKNGAVPVLVSETDKKVFKLAGKDVKAHLDHKVKITGEIKGDVLTVADVQKAE